MKLKELRKEKKYNQEIVAKYLGVTQATLSGWENEKFEPDIESLKKLAHLYNVSVDYLIDFDSSKKFEIYNNPIEKMNQNSNELMRIANSLDEQNCSILIEFGKILKKLGTKPQFNTDSIQLVAENSFDAGIKEIDDETEHN